MRALRVVGLGIDGRTVILETVEQRSGERRERFTLPADEGLHAAVRGDLPRLGQIEIELESQMRPREIQARIRAGASVEQVAAAAGVPLQRIERFAYPVLLERSRTAQLAQQAHPVRADGPDVRTLEEVVSETFAKRGHDYSAVTWDSWRGENGKWVVQLRWRAGRSENKAHWTFHPGAHGGTVTAIDDYAIDLVDPQPATQLRPLAPVTPLTDPGPGSSDETGSDGAVARPDPASTPAGTAPRTDPASTVAGAREADPLIADPLVNDQQRARVIPDDTPPYRPARPAAQPPVPAAAPDRPTEAPRRPPEQPAAQPERAPLPAASAAKQSPATQAPAPKRGRKERPMVPSWEDVLLGVRSPRE